MSELIIRQASINDRGFIRSVSERTWPSTYGHIITQAQIEFMLDWMYSDAALAEQFEQGHQFYIASYKGEEIGFCSVSNEDGHLNSTGSFTERQSFKLNKLYVLPTFQGTGAGKALLMKSIEAAKKAGAHTLFLQVNKLNNAVTFYQKQGFTKEADLKFDIGNGFFMDDYVMRFNF